MVIAGALNMEQSRLENVEKHALKFHQSPPTPDSSATEPPLEISTPSKANGKASSATPAPPSPAPPNQNGNAAKSTQQPQLQQRVTASEKNGTPSPQRRSSWFSNMTSRFSPSPSNGQGTPTNGSPHPGSDEVTPLPKISPGKNAVLPPAVRQAGDAPYTPAPPGSSRPGFLGVLRRLSSSNAPAHPNSRANHGLVERRILNVDNNRERCRVNELSQAKLRRVSFCVDVEIAPMPRYADEVADSKMSVEKCQKRKIKEKGEGEALKNPKALTEQKEQEGVVRATGETLPKEPEKEGTEAPSGQTDGHTRDTPKEGGELKAEQGMTRKKEKKKKSEAERKAKKEQKRKEALEKGTIPMEIHLDSDSSSEVSLSSGPPSIQVKPTTNPARIYRRCCQLRETDILTKITHQLPKSTEDCPDGLVEKLDLTDYFLPLRDLITLGDFLAVVPVKEIVLENCGLTDEGVRVVLAGLLAARKPQVKYRKSTTKPAGLVPQGGVVERVVLRNNKIGAEGWRHIGLFIHLCRSIKSIDLSKIPFPAPAEPVKTPLTQHHHFHLSNGSHNGGHGATAPPDVSLLFSKALSERLAGSELELVNLGATGMTAHQLGVIVDGILKAGVIRLGLSHNNLDAEGVQHVARYLRSAKCEGIDLGGNDLRRHLETIAGAIDEHNPLWAISLANCNLDPASLRKILPNFTKLSGFRFLDLSHNQDLFESEPSALCLLRRCLPKLENLKRLHLADVSMSPEQAIALAEILPEVKTLAHINLLENPSLESLAEANTEEKKEEACALYASLLAAVRVSRSLVKVDIDEPGAEAGELVKALANQVVAYCMRNLQGVPDIRDAGGEQNEVPKYPDILRHLVGFEGDSPTVGIDDIDEPAPDDDYVIGGTGVVKALTCCLKNMSDDNGRQPGEFMKELETGTITPDASLSSARAKDMPKILLGSARKIRVRLQPALAAAKARRDQDMNNYNRLLFLDQTIEGIIKRFENEFPETREPDSPEVKLPDRTAPLRHHRTFSADSADGDAILSDAEETGTAVRSPSRSRSNSIISHTSRALAEEEGRALRVGHRFRRNFLRPEHYGLLTSTEEIKNDPAHTKLIASLLDELSEEDEGLWKKLQEQGAVKTFQEEREFIVKRLRDKDPQYWESFIESQEKARANVKVGSPTEPSATDSKETNGKGIIVDEQAIVD
ncbi:hypothetical protein DL770_008815 [Monosporascus sp. CRB-9-2]|nr:hypothetical protein DL770_008815 [Monosporascus sp. CRB-9-2]